MGAAMKRLGFSNKPMSHNLQTIIITTGVPSGEQWKREILALKVYDTTAVTLPYKSTMLADRETKSFVNTRWEGRKYAVTHLPSGFIVCAFDNVSCARAVASVLCETFAGFGPWRSQHPSTVTTIPDLKAVVDALVALQPKTIESARAQVNATLRAAGWVGK